MKNTLKNIIATILALILFGSIYLSYKITKDQSDALEKYGRIDTAIVIKKIFGSKNRGVIYVFYVNKIRIQGVYRSNSNQLYKVEVGSKYLVKYSYKNPDLYSELLINNKVDK